ncbi:MAG: glycosyltransferase [Deltaproteobacteria bacterium]|nr:glycosyltransferase [Deltaproteobacteria bacterium]MDP2969947.1 glycosyltransferase [Deltaproteobacteria bacterium]MDP3016986.1 glycosyltransferase [Deltaproteobacteria bacterium]
MSVYVREVAREMGRRGHLVDVYTRIHEPIHDKVIKIGQNARLIHLRAGEEEIQKLAIYYHLADFARDLDNFRKQNGLRYDLIHSHYWLSGLAGKRLQQWWDVPHVMGFHTLGAVKNAIGIGEGEPDLRINAEKELVRDCHRIIASTMKGKKDLIDYYDASPETISVIPCGVNLDLFRPIGRETARCYLGLKEERIILFVGRIIPLKGIDNLLKAMTYLERKEGIKLVVIGGDEHCQTEVERLKDLSRSLKIQESVIFLGLVKQEILPFFYSAANLCVVPSYYESFGLVVLESLACGTPVVATRVGGAESVIRHGETGYVVRNNDSCHLADKIALFLSTSNGDTEFVGTVRASVVNYSWSNITEAILAEYRSVLGDFSARVRKEIQEFWA